MYYKGLDLQFFILALKNCYKNHGGLEAIFTKYQEQESLQVAISKFKSHFFEIPHQKRTEKHVSDPWLGWSPFARHYLGNLV